MVCVIGEALIDLVQDGAAGDGPNRYLAHPGGSPYNVAIGLARLGRGVQLLARLSGDSFGRQLREHAAANGVDLSLAVAAAEPSTLAVVSVDAQGNASYDFHRTGTADWQWSAAELARLPADADWIHTGSLASWTPPGAAVIEAELSRRHAGSGAVLSFDPNIRPDLIADRPAAVQTVQRLVGLSRVVKASAEDLDWLYPAVGVEAVLQQWLQLGPELIVITDGGRGAHAVTPGGTPFTVPARAVQVVDTVGAGDAFMAGLINALIANGTLTDDIAESAVRAAVEEAILVATLTCSRAGADPPTAAELEAAGQS